MPDKSFSLARNPRGIDRFHGFLLIAIVLIAVAERVYGVDRQSLWSDELYAVMASYKGSFKELLQLMLTDSHPPGYVSFMYITLPWLGYSDFSIRLHSLIAGILWVPLVFWLGWRWFSQRAGLIAATLVASAYPAVYYSQEARCYAMLVAVCLLNLACFLEIIFVRNRKPFCLALFAITALFSVSLHYSALIFLSIEAISLFGLFLIKRDKEDFLLGFKLFFTPFSLTFFWIYLTHDYTVSMGEAWAVSDVPTLKDIFYGFRRLLGIELLPGMPSIVRNPLDFYLCTLPAAFFLAFYLYRKEKIYTQRFLLILLFFAVLIVPVVFYYVISNLSTPIFNYRYFIFGMPIAALLSAFFIDYLVEVAVSKPFQKPFVMIVLIGLTVWGIKANLSRGLYDLDDKDKVREAVHYIATDLGVDKTDPNPNYTVLMTHDWFEHYLRTENIRYDNSWKGHVYYSQFDAHNVESYLQSNASISYFYYLVLREITSKNAVAELRIRNQLLSTASFEVPSGVIDVYKFSVADPQTVPTDLVRADGPLNLAMLDVASKIKKSDKKYTMLLTQSWIERYFIANNLPYDPNWNGRYYYLETQLNDLSVYFKKHDDIESFYYVMVVESSVQNALQALKKCYQLLDSTDVQMSGGVRVQILHFKIPDAARTNDLDRALTQMDSKIQSGGMKYTMLLTQPWVEHYFIFNKLPYDQNWNGRYYYLETQINELSAYFKSHPDIDRFCYVLVVEPGTVKALETLQKHYHQLDSSDVLMPGGLKLQIISFSVR